jgi:hypothetical protein
MISVIIQQSQKTKSIKTTTQGWSWKIAAGPSSLTTTGSVETPTMVL